MLHSNDLIYSSLPILVTVIAIRNLCANSYITHPFAPCSCSRLRFLTPNSWSPEPRTRILHALSPRSPPGTSAAQASARSASQDLGRRSDMFHHGLCLAYHMQRVALPSQSWFHYKFFGAEAQRPRNLHARSPRSPPRNERRASDCDQCLQ